MELLDTASLLVSTKAEHFHTPWLKIPLLTLIPPRLHMFSSKDTLKNVHSVTNCNSQKLEISWISTITALGEEIVS